MQKPMKIKDTFIITGAKNAQYNTEDLPPGIRYEVETYDRLRQDALDLEYEFEKVMAAIKVKENTIRALVEQLEESLAKNAEGPSDTPNPVTATTEEPDLKRHRPAKNRSAK